MVKRYIPHARPSWNNATKRTVFSAENGDRKPPSLNTPFHQCSEFGELHPNPNTDPNLTERISRDERKRKDGWAGREIDREHGERMIKEKEKRNRLRRHRDAVRRRGCLGTEGRKLRKREALSLL